MWLYRSSSNKGLDYSSYSEINFVFKKDKFYIMDNHLAASWCWIQEIDQNKSYNLFHIDRHYDLSEFSNNKLIDINRKEIASQDFNNFSNRYCSSNSISLIKWDNYIDFFLRIYPSIIDKFYFATHKEGEKSIKIDLDEKDIWELPESLGYWINKTMPTQWIVNIDIDYFFTDNGNSQIQLLSDKCINTICANIESSLSNISVVTIALSPVFCIDSSSAFRIVDIISDYFNLDFDNSQLL